MQSGKPKYKNGAFSFSSYEDTMYKYSICTSGHIDSLPGLLLSASQEYIVKHDSTHATMEEYSLKYTNEFNTVETH